MITNGRINFLRRALGAGRSVLEETPPVALSDVCDAILSRCGDGAEWRFSDGFEELRGLRRLNVRPQNRRIDSR